MVAVVGDGGHGNLAAAQVDTCAGDATHGGVVHSHGDDVGRHRRHAVDDEDGSVAGILSHSHGTRVVDVAVVPVLEVEAAVGGGGQRGGGAVVVDAATGHATHRGVVGGHGDGVLVDGKGGGQHRVGGHDDGAEGVGVVIAPVHEVVTGVGHSGQHGGVTVVVDACATDHTHRAVVDGEGDEVLVDGEVGGQVQAARQDNGADGVGVAVAPVHEVVTGVGNRGQRDGVALVEDAGASHTAHRGVVHGQRHSVEHRADVDGQHQGGDTVAASGVESGVNIDAALRVGDVVPDIAVEGGDAVDRCGAVVDRQQDGHDAVAAVRGGQTISHHRRDGVERIVPEEAVAFRNGVVGGHAVVDCQVQGHHAVATGGVGRRVGGGVVVGRVGRAVPDVAVASHNSVGAVSRYATGRVDTHLHAVNPSVVGIIAVVVDTELDNIERQVGFEVLEVVLACGGKGATGPGVVSVVGHAVAEVQLVAAAIGGIAHTHMQAVAGGRRGDDGRVGILVVVAGPAVRAEAQHGVAVEGDIAHTIGTADVGSVVRDSLPAVTCGAGGFEALDEGHVDGVAGRTETDGSSPCAGVVAAVGLHHDRVSGVGIKTGDCVGICRDVVSHVTVQAEVPCVGIGSPAYHSGIAAATDVSGREIGRGQAGGRLGYIEGVVLGHAPCVGGTRIGVGCSGNGAGVVVEEAVGAHDTHPVEARCLCGGNVEGGGQCGGIVIFTFTCVDHLVALEHHVVVPVDPDDGAVVIAGGVGDFHRGSGAGGHRSDHSAVVTIERCCSRVRRVGQVAEGDTGDTLAIP